MWPGPPSGRLVVSTQEDCLASMEPHVVNDVTITLEERNQIEANLNGHTLQLARIFKMGGDHGHWDRITSALVNKSGHIPVLYGLVMDHKVSAQANQTSVWR